MSPEALLFLGITSVVFFIGTLIAIPFALVKLPHDYFDETQPRVWLKGRPQYVRFAAFALKNMVGVIFLLAGLAMLVLPGQGILTMLIGISLLDFPGKRRLERNLLGRPAVLKAINKIRERFGRPPLIVR